MMPTSLLFQLSLDLLQNAALVVLGVLGYCWARGPLARWPRWVRETTEGLICAALALLCVAAPLWLSEGVRIDSRNAIVALSVIFSGPLAGVIAAAATAMFRLWLGGIGAVGGALIVIGTYFTALAYRYWLIRSGTTPRYPQLAVLGFLVYAFMVVGLVIHPVDVALEILGTVALPALAIVPGSIFLFGSLVLAFDRSRALERAVVESEVRLRSVIDNLPHPLTIKDRENRFLIVNKAFERVTGLAAAEVIGQPMDMVTDMVAGGGALANVAREVWRTGATRTTEPLWFRFHGRRYSVIVTSFPIRNPEGRVDAIGAINIDVSELTEAREILERRRAALERQQRALTEIVRANAFMERSVTFSDSVRAITEAAGEVMEVEYTHVFQIDDQAGISRCLDAWVRSAGHHDRVPDADLCQYRKLLADLDREQVIVVDASDDRVAARRELLAARNIKSGIIAGIYLGTHLLGHIDFAHVDSARQWTPEELAFTRSIADLIALMVVTSQHREALASLDLVDDGIYVEREDGRVIYANRAALAVAGRSDGGAARYEPTISFPRAPAPLEADRDHHEISWMRDGAARDLELRRTRLPAGGIVTVIEDITQKKAEAFDRERLQLHLQQASKMEAIGQLASGIAHDFNNLLGAVIGFAGFLAQDLPVGSAQHQFAERILRACHRGKDLVAQILAFTRTRTPEKRPLDLRSVLKDSRELLAGSLPTTRRLAFQLGDEPLIVEGNEAELGQLIINLCLNAHDAMGSDTGDITVALAKIRPGDADYKRALLVGGLTRDRAYARLDVTDVGAGILPENLPRVFEPFFTTKERGRGTGLGLAVAHGIITSYSGACGVVSRPGHGTRFSVYLPLAKTGTASSREATPRGDVRGRERILVVDDEVDITDMLSIGLERLGYEVAAMNDPLEAMEVVTEEPAAWHAVIVDHLMPRLQGTMLAAKLKALRPEMIVILCTGLDDGTVQAQVGSAIDAFFPKPVEPEQLAAAIRDLSRYHEGRRA